MGDVGNICSCFCENPVYKDEDEEEDTSTTTEISNGAPNGSGSSSTSRHLDSEDSNSDLNLLLSSLPSDGRSLSSAPLYLGASNAPSVRRRLGSSGVTTVTEDTKILIPSAKGCDECDMGLCMSHFESCSVASVISVHCMDRNSILPPLTILGGIMLTLILTLIGVFRESRRVRGLVGQLRKIGL